ncbi:MAG: hypothetical protein ACREJ3_00420 [Polyangiaceae bacterium]
MRRSLRPVSAGFAVVFAVVSAACGRSRAVVAPAASRVPADEGRARTAEFVRVEDDALGWLAAADPRLALRIGSRAPEATLDRIAMDAVLVEDASAALRAGSLDLFAFRGRARALGKAAAEIQAFRGPLPETAPPGSSIARPRLERELLARLIAEEQVRAGDDANLESSSGDMVRAILATWTPPSIPSDWEERDTWVAGRLRQIRDSLRARPPSGPIDLDAALYPLERLLAPLEFPRSSAAIAELRVSLDEDMRPIPPLVAPERIAREAAVHLGVTLDMGTLPTRIERIESRLRILAQSALDKSGAERPSVEARARALLFVERPCPAVPDTRVRSMRPPPERAAICGALSALEEEANPATAIVALHDDVFIALAAIVAAPPARTGLLSHPEDDVVDALRREARERPIPALGVALAAEIIYSGDKAEEHLHEWRALGDAPLDVVARELDETSLPASQR